MHDTVHHAVDHFASGSLVHKTVELPVCTQRTLVFGTRLYPSSRLLSATAASRGSCIIGQRVRSGMSPGGPFECTSRIYRRLALQSE
jgi:hypothetical protein